METQTIELLNSSFWNDGKVKASTQSSMKTFWDENKFSKASLFVCTESISTRLIRFNVIEIYLLTENVDRSFRKAFNLIMYYLYAVFITQ